MSNDLSKVITRLIFELSLAFVGVTLGLEVRNYQDINKCKQLLVDNQIESPYFCENSQLRDNYLQRIDKIDPRLAYEQVLAEYCGNIECTSQTSP